MLGIDYARSQFIIKNATNHMVQTTIHMDDMTISSDFFKKIPARHQKQDYINSRGGLMGGCYATIDLSTGSSKIATIKIKAVVWSGGFRLDSCNIHDHSYSVSVAGLNNRFRDVNEIAIIIKAASDATNYTNVKLPASTDAPTSVGGNIPYTELQITHNLELEDKDAISNLARMVKERGLTDVVLMIHGFSNTLHDARSIYNSYFSHFHKSGKNASGQPVSIGVCGVMWIAQYSNNVIAQMASFMVAQTYAATVGEALGKLLNAYSSQIGARIHLAGHSLGCQVIRGALSVMQPGIAKSAFLIQGATPAYAFNDLCRRVDGPVVCTYSGKDTQLSRWYRTVNISTPAIGTNGPIDNSGRQFKKMDMAKEGAKPNPKYYSIYTHGDIVGLHATQLGDHDGYKNDAFAYAHMITLGLNT